MLGYAEHQRVSVVHHDTDDVHIHVAINKIHPTTLTLHDPVRDYKKRSKLCAILEHELGLAQDNHEKRGRLPRQRPRYQPRRQRRLENTLSDVRFLVGKDE